MIINKENQLLPIKNSLLIHLKHSRGQMAIQSELVLYKPECESGSPEGLAKTHTAGLVPSFQDSRECGADGAGLGTSLRTSD